VLGLDLGGTKIGLCVGGADGSIGRQRRFATPRGGPTPALDAIDAEAAALIAQDGPIAAIGISCGGPLDAKTGTILSPPNLPGWDAVPITKLLSERFGVPAALQNDANACAVAEWRLGAGRGARSLVFCTMGTGFGCGLILDGRLYEGTNGYAGEIGHIRLTPDGPVGYGKAGSVEGFCGGSGIAQLAKLRLDAWLASGHRTRLAAGPALSAQNVAEAAEAGDELARRIFGEVGDRLGAALAMAVDLLNPERIILGSIFVRAERWLRPAMEAALARECLPAALAACHIFPAELGENLGAVAALLVAPVAGRVRHG